MVLRVLLTWLGYGVFSGVLMSVPTVAPPHPFSGVILRPSFTFWVGSLLFAGGGGVCLGFLIPGQNL